MLKSDTIEHVIELHEKSYKFLKWVNNSLSHGVLKFDVVHNAMSTSDASREWIKRHFYNIPLDIRPDEDHIDEFAHLFASYLTTSFKPIKPRYILKSYCGCYCTVCSYLVSVAYLIPRKLTKKARKYALELKHICLSSLAEELELALTDSEINQLLKNRELSEKISMLTYCNELVRRTQFVSQGEGVLVLWREIAWEKTAPKKGFRLKTNDILNAEKMIMGKMLEYQ
ncbi:MAG: hypothetical protein GY749_03235 [Desulfobacteraceae bacterium]|nr:hypothetical protein [Desulfobacteraceae bacterium]